MGRARKNHVQQQIRWPNATGDLRGRKREAGKGRGKKQIGRPKKPGAGQPHARRETFKSSEPIHVTLRVDRDIGWLRTRAGYRAIREATITVLEHESFRIIHLSIQGTHIHLLVEAQDRRALSKGMQAFKISTAKQLNAAVSKAGSWWERAKLRRELARRPGAGGQQGARIGLPERRRGRVFADRYHATIIRSPKQARHELAYVLNNWRKHGEHRKQVARGWKIDPFATGWLFQGWKEREHEPFAWKLRETYEPMPVWWPRTWLLKESWRRYGLISTHEVPGKRFAEPRA